jgi:hypothetical protein
MDPAELIEHIGTGASGYDDARVQQRQSAKEILGSMAHAGLIGMRDNRRQSPIEIEGAQSRLNGEPVDNPKRIS